MKNLKSLLFCCLFTLSLGVMAQVPEIAKDHFTQQYPDATAVEWEEDEDGYEVEFSLDGKELEAVYNSKGTFIQEEEEIASEELPAAVSDLIEYEYKGYIFEESTRITRGDHIFYEVELSGASAPIELLIDEGGSLVSGPKMEDEEND